MHEKYNQIMVDFNTLILIIISQETSTENPPGIMVRGIHLLYIQNYYYNYSLHPRALAKSLRMAVLPGQAGAVIRLPSTTDWSASTSTKLPPASFTSAPRGGYAVRVLPRSTSAAVST